jgi:coenzyme PQQ precursor peptide PqqA
MKARLSTRSINWTLVEGLCETNANVLLRGQAQHGTKGCYGKRRSDMKWTTPKVAEVCVGMEINDYFPAEL